LLRHESETARHGFLGSNSRSCPSINAITNVSKFGYSRTVRAASVATKACFIFASASCTNCMLDLTLEYVDRALDELKSIDFLLTIILTGSYARGDFDKSSDIDIVLITQREASRRELFSRLPASPIRSLVSLHPISSASFVTMYQNGNLFVRHVITEGKTLFDRGFYRSLRRDPMPFSNREMFREWDLTKKRLELYSDADIFNYLFKECLSRIYHMACRIAIVASAIDGNPTFNKETAFGRLIRSYPKCGKDVSQLMTLRRFAVPVSRFRQDSSQSLASISSASVEMSVTSLKSVIREVEASEQFKDHQT